MLYCFVACFKVNVLWLQLTDDDNRCCIIFSHVGILVSWYAAMQQSFPYFVIC